MISKPAVSGRPSVIATTSVSISNNPTELIGVHYLNLTSGAGRVNLRDGGPAGEIRIVLGASVQNETDNFCPSQPAKFLKSLYVEFETGSGVVSVLMN